MMEVRGKTLLGATPLYAFPWFFNTDPSDNGPVYQFARTTGSTGNHGHTSQQPTALHSMIAVYLYGTHSNTHLQGTSSSMASSVSGSNTTSLHAWQKTGNYTQPHLSGCVVWLPKGAAEVGVVYAGTTQNSGVFNMGTKIMGVLYTQEEQDGGRAFTINGTKYIDGGGNPETDFDAAATHTDQPFAQVRKITLDNPIKGVYSHMLVGTELFVIHNDDQLIRGEAFVWNFTTQEWDRMSDCYGGGRALSSNASGWSKCYGFYRVADHVGPSNEIFIRQQVINHGSFTNPRITDEGTMYVYGGFATPAD